jgi:hypothetical protein
VFPEEYSIVGQNNWYFFFAQIHCSQRDMGLVGQNNMGFVVFCQVSPIHVLFAPRSVFFAIDASLKTAIVTQQQVSTTVERVISLSIFSFTCYRHLYSKSILALVWVVSSLISY